MDEGTEIKDETGTTLRAELIPGAADVVRRLKQDGYKLALVADGPVGTFQNVLTQHNLLGQFDVLAISAELGVEKPERLMFEYALAALGIPPDGYHRTMMVGNNLAA